MSALAWLSPARWLLLAAAVGALTLGYLAWAGHQQDIGDARATARHTKAIDQQKSEAAQLLASETARVVAVEKALQEFKNSQDLQDAKNQQTVAGLSARLRGLAGPSGRLRDPHAAAGCGRSGSGPQGATATAPADRADDATQTGGLLSSELSGLLQRLIREADDINTAYASCRADTYSVRAAGK